MNKGKNTGFKVNGEPLYVGDWLSIHGGYCGFVEVVEKDNDFYLAEVDIDSTYVDRDSLSKIEMISHNLKNPYSKVFKDEPSIFYANIFCQQCGEVIGKYEAEGGFDLGKCKIFDTCGSFEMIGGEEINAKCTLCESDPSRTNPQTPIMDYFFEKHKKTNLKVVSGHWPDFESTEEVDEWISHNENIASFITKLLQSKTDRNLPPRCH